MIQAHKRKHRRVELACKKCREKKTRCDGLHPACSACVKENLICSYVPVTVRSDAKTSESDRTSILEQRISELEGQLAESRLYQYGILQQEAACSSSAPAHGLLVDHGSASTHHPEEEAAVDALATNAFSSQDLAPAGIGHFGPSSNHGYFRVTSHFLAYFSLSNMLPNPVSTQHWPKTHPTIVSSSAARRPIGPTEVFVLPPSEVANSLFNQFFDRAGLMMPYINRSAVLQGYSDAMDDRFRSVNKLQRALYSIIWAHGALGMESEDPESYYRCAMSLLSSFVIREANEEMLQLLLLVCAYQQANCRSVASWTFHALAVKTAFQMGLHAPATYDNLSPESRLMRQNFWFGVVNHDRFLATMLGRPYLIPRQHAKIPSLPIEAYLNTTTNIHSALNTRVLSFTTHLTQYYDILAQTVETLYDHNITEAAEDATQTLPKRLRLVLELEAWRASLQSPLTIIQATRLQMETAQAVDKIWPSILLTMHYRRAQLLMNRPVIVSSLRRWFSAEVSLPPVNDLVMPIILGDFDAAMEIVNVIQNVVTADTEFLPRHFMWFLANYSLFGSAVHIFAILCACQREETIFARSGMTRASIKTAAVQALDLLRNVGIGSLMSQKAASCLLTFIDMLDAFLAAPSDSLFYGSHNNEGVLSSESHSVPLDAVSSFINQITEDFFLDGRYHDFMFDQYTLQEH